MGSGKVVASNSLSVLLFILMVLLSPLVYDLTAR